MSNGFPWQGWWRMEAERRVSVRGILAVMAAPLVFAAAFVVMADPCAGRKNHPPGIPALDAPTSSRSTEHSIAA